MASTADEVERLAAAACGEEYGALPGYLRDNEYIHRHYRCEWPLPQLLLSAFPIHNETLSGSAIHDHNKTLEFAWKASTEIVGDGGSCVKTHVWTEPSMIA
ncbi:hypothetical protein SEVIR_9G480950v4 [Setaria viridis]